MARTQNAVAPQRGSVEVVLTKEELQELIDTAGAEVRIPNGRYVLVIKAEADDTVDVDAFGDPVIDDEDALDV